MITLTEIHIFLIYTLAFIGLFGTSFYILSLFSFYKTPVKLSSEIKTVSIIIPAYNEEKSIVKTIKSALSLNYLKDKFEIIIVDDGSEDNTYALAKKYESATHPIVKVFSKKNGGKGSALNLGIKNSKSEIIVSMDADTFVEKNALTHMVAHFYNDRVMAVTPSMGVYNPKNFLQKIQQVEYYMGVFLRKAFATVNAIHVTPGAFSAYSKKFFDKYGGYDENNITEDLEIALRIQNKGYIIENAPDAVIYTMSPLNFKELLVQRRRWYVGMIKNLWNYKELFGYKKGALGLVVLPIATITVILSIVLVIYLVIDALMNLKNELIMLNSVNFKFRNPFEIDKYILENFFHNIFSQPVFLISFLFLFLIGFYLYFSRKKMKYTESLKFSFLFFILSYSFLFVFWWIVSIFYVVFDKKVVWREKSK